MKYKSQPKERLVWSIVILSNIPKEGDLIMLKIIGMQTQSSFMNLSLDVMGIDEREWSKVA